MATFVNVYLFTFIRTPSAHKLLTQALKLTVDEQVKTYINFVLNIFKNHRNGWQSNFFLSSKANFFTTPTHTHTKKAIWNKQAVTRTLFFTSKKWQNVCYFYIKLSLLLFSYKVHYVCILRYFLQTQLFFFIHFSALSPSFNVVL